MVEQDFNQAEVNEKAKDEKKSHKLLYIIIAILILLALLATLVVYLVSNRKVDMDIILTRRINEDVATYESFAGKPSDIRDVVLHAEASGYYMDRLDCVTKGRHIVWDSEHNVYLLLDENDKILYCPLDKAVLVNLNLAWEFSEVPVSKCSRFVFYREKTCVTEETRTTKGGVEYSEKVYHGLHDYSVRKQGNSYVYTCDVCGYSYSVGK